MNCQLDCRFLRRFGVEIELNPNVKTFNRPSTSEGEIMPGSDIVGQIVSKTSGDEVEIQGWDYIHNNSGWVIKHDMSCGIEINSPVLKGWSGLSKLLRVIDALGKKWPYCDDRCSFHVHVSVEDLTKKQLATVIAYYIKCEHVFLDAMPTSRKNNRYCQPIGLGDLFSHDFNMDIEDLFESVSCQKYYSMNAYHYRQGIIRGEERKKAIEFRVAENKACIDPMIAKNWIRLLLHFVNVTSQLELPKPYQQGDPHSGLLWLDPQEVFSLLKFDQPLSPGLTQVKEWFMKRIYRYGVDSEIKNGIWSEAGRKSSREDFMEMYNETNFKQTDGDKIYDKNWVL